MYDDPVKSVSLSVYKALLMDLPDVYFTRPRTGEIVKIRPSEAQIDVKMWSQTWSSTALGFGGIGGQSITPAYTVVVINGDFAAVYFSGRFAYLVEAWGTDRTFRQDMHDQNLVGVKEAARRYQLYDAKKEAETVKAALTGVSSDADSTLG